MTLPLLQEYFTEAEAQAHVLCPFKLGKEGPCTCEGHYCGAWRWKHERVTYERGEPVGFCGVGPRP